MKLSTKLPRHLSEQLTWHYPEHNRIIVIRSLCYHPLILQQNHSARALDVIFQTIHISYLLIVQIKAVAHIPGGFLSKPSDCKRIFSDSVPLHQFRDCPCPFAGVPVRLSGSLSDLSAHLLDVRHTYSRNSCTIATIVFSPPLINRGIRKEIKFW